MEKYLGKTYLGQKTLAYHSSIGCPFTCSFCAVVPTYDFARANMVVSFGADFLGTFGAPVAQARGFAAMRARLEAGTFVAVEPRLSHTGASGSSDA